MEINWFENGFDPHFYFLLRQKAAEVGANAVVGIRMETNTIFDGCLDLVIYGTAIRFTR